MELLRIFYTLNLFLFNCYIVQGTSSKENKKRYILYDVNPGEGFNLRRDVFNRMAVFVKNLNSEEHNFVLVLPPWGDLYHWQSSELGPQNKIPWRTFFDIESINRFVPVMEFEEFITKFSSSKGLLIDALYYLQSYAEGWQEGGFIEKWDRRECIAGVPYVKTPEGTYTGRFWNFRNVKAKHFECISVQGSTSVIKSLVMESNLQSIMFDRAENLLHEFFGGPEYWSVRKSVRFSKPLVKIANEFRKKYLKSADVDDNTVMAPKWEDDKPPRSLKKGGPYICAHLRRKDFLNSRSHQVPSLKGATEQLKEKLKKKGLTKLFISSDCPDEEFQTLKSYMNKTEVYRFLPDFKTLNKYKDGGVAIVDQSICSHARYFIGSFESTFTFRIQEEREIMGFETSETFDILCPDGQADCSKGSVWKIVHPENVSHQEL